MRLRPSAVQPHMHMPRSRHRAAQVARRVRVLPPDTPLLEARLSKGPGGAAGESSKVAAGIEVAYTVTFRPQAAGDYAADLVVTTERESFLVPVRCIGPAAVLDLPDQLAFDASPVSIEGSQVLLVSNVGKRAGAFSLRTWGPFSVSPSQGHLQPGEGVQVSLSSVAQHLAMQAAAVA